MLEIPKGQMTEADRAILRRLRVWIAGLAAACLVVGIGIGALLSGNRAVAQHDAATAMNIARAPEALSASFAEIARRVEPAVVNIDTIASPQISVGRDEGDETDEDEKEGTGNPLLDMLRRQRRRPSRGVGSGFIIDPKGLILTNHHVIEGTTRINVRLQSGETLRGEVVGVDEETDLAVVRVQAGRDLPSLRLGNSDEAQVGDWVLAIGSPFNLEQTVTAGIISARERQTDPTATFQHFLQTDAAINRGNSGGPLVNMRGEVIGINSQIATSTGDYNGIGFALPANEAGFVYRQIVNGGRVRRGYLGIYLQPVRAEFARVYGLPEAKGAIVRDVADQQGPAAKAGIQTNDIITAFNGQPVLSAQDLINKVAATGVGETIELTYLRESNNKLEERKANVSVGERPPNRPALGDEERERGPAEQNRRKSSAEGEAGTAAGRPSLGLKVSELTPQLAAERKVEGTRGLLVTNVDPGGLASEAGLDEGAIIQRVNRIPVSTLADFQSVVGALKPNDAVVMHVVEPDGGRVLRRIVQFTFQ